MSGKSKRQPAEEIDNQIRNVCNARDGSDNIYDALSKENESYKVFIGGVALGILGNIFKFYRRRGEK